MYKYYKRETGQEGEWGQGGGCGCVLGLGLGRGLRLGLGAVGGGGGSGSGRWRRWWKKKKQYIIYMGEKQVLTRGALLLKKLTTNYLTTQ